MTTLPTELDIPEYCGNGHSLSDHLVFRKDNRSSRGYRWGCQMCEKRYKLAYRYGITPEQFEDMLLAQDNKCVICDKVFGEDAKNRPYVDHDHGCCDYSERKACGKCVRGLVCVKCNSLLGMAEDNEKILLSAVSYLRNNGV